MPCVENHVLPVCAAMSASKCASTPCCCKTVCLPSVSATDCRHTQPLHKLEDGCIGTVAVGLGHSLPDHIVEGIFDIQKQHSVGALAACKMLLKGTHEVVGVVAATISDPAKLLICKAAPSLV